MIDPTNRVQLCDVCTQFLYFSQMVWIESPTNPMLICVDIEKVSEIAHRYNLLVVVDNTFLSSYFQVF